jgi:DNA-binding NarL/FixJ family response regulator
MKRVYLANGHPDERLALRLLLADLNLELVGEAADWPSALRLAPGTFPDMVVVDWGLVAEEPGDSLKKLRSSCKASLIIVLISQLNAREQVALSTGADAFISKSETSDRIIKRLQAAIDSVPL